MRTVALLLSFLLFSFAGCLQPSVESDALAYLQDRLPDQDTSGHILIMDAAVAAGEDPDAWPMVDHPVAEGLDDVVPESYGDVLRLTHARGLSGSFGGVWADLTDAAWEGHDGEQFGSTASIVDDALAVSALIAAGADPSDDRIWNAVRMLHAVQADDGGWRYDGGAPGEPDETALVLRALNDAGSLDAGAAMAARGFLTDRMATDGSYGYGGTSNCQSTGLALLAWAALGDDAPEATQEYVRVCQNSDGGFPYLKGGPSQVWATADVLHGLAARP